MGGIFGVSVVVATHDGREAMAMRLVDSFIEAASFAELPNELIMVDSSTQPRRKDLEAYCEKASVRYLRGPQPATPKRNIGARAARYDAILFTDSDCLLTPATLREHEKLLSLPSSVGGVIGPVDFTGRKPPLWPVLEWSAMWGPFFDYGRHYQQVLWGVTANFCVRREVFEQVDGFNNKILTSTGGEDVDLGVRMKGAGYTLQANADAVVLHKLEHITAARMARTLYTCGSADPYLCKEHPDHTEIYLNPIAWSALAFAAGGLVRRRASSAVAWSLIAWWAATLRRQAEQPYLPDAEAKFMTGPEDVLLSLAAGILDSCFDIGRLRPIIQLRRFDMLVKRFQYVNSKWFVPADRDKRPVVASPS